MKKITLSLIAAALMASQSGNIQAQEDTKFDFTSAGNYCIIYLDEESAAGIQDKILLDLTTAQIDVWPEGQSLVFNDAIGQNSQGVKGGAFLSVASASWDQQWYGGGFNTGVRDLSKITDNFHFHMAIRSEDEQSFSFSITGSKDHEAQIILGTEPMDGKQPFDNFDRDGDWHIIDISVAELKQEGWVAGVIEYSPFSFSIGGETPGVGFDFDSVFYYEPNGSSNIEGSYVNEMDVIVGERTISVLGSEAGIELYDISGSLIKSTKNSVIGTESISSGIYLVKSGAFVKKVYIK